MIEQLERVWSQIAMQPCSLRRVWRTRRLSIGFGPLREGVPGVTRPLWELGSYYSAWRFVRDGRVLAGSQDVVDAIADLDTKVNAIEVGAVLDIEQLPPFDIRLHFDGRLILDFLNTTSEDDDIFHIFGPEHVYAGFSPLTGWTLGRSDVPTSSDSPHPPT